MIRNLCFLLLFLQGTLQIDMMVILDAGSSSTKLNFFVERGQPCPTLVADGAGTCSGKPITLLPGLTKIADAVSAKYFAAYTQFLTKNVTPLTHTVVKKAIYATAGNRIIDATEDRAAWARVDDSLGFIGKYTMHGTEEAMLELMATSDDCSPILSTGGASAQIAMCLGHANGLPLGEWMGFYGFIHQGMVDHLSCQTEQGIEDFIVVAQKDPNSIYKKVPYDRIAIECSADHSTSGSKKPCFGLISFLAGVRAGGAGGCVTPEEIESVGQSNAQPSINVIRQSRTGPVEVPTTPMYKMVEGVPVQLETPELSWSLILSNTVEEQRLRGNDVKPTLGEWSAAGNFGTFMVGGMLETAIAFKSWLKGRLYISPEDDARLLVMDAGTANPKYMEGLCAYFRARGVEGLAGDAADDVTLLVIRRYIHQFMEADAFFWGVKGKIRKFNDIKRAQGPFEWVGAGQFEKFESQKGDVLHVCSADWSFPENAMHVMANLLHVDTRNTPVGGDSVMLRPALGNVNSWTVALAIQNGFPVVCNSNLLNVNLNLADWTQTKPAKEPCQWKITAVGLLALESSIEHLF